MKKSKSYKIFVYTLLTFFTIAFSYPFLNALLMSFMSYQELQQFPLPFWPEKFQFSNYAGIYGAFGVDEAGNSYVGRFLLNTLFIMVLATTGKILSCTICAYGFAKIKFAGSGFCFMLILSTMMIPGSIMTIPLFTMFKWFGWLDTLTPLWLPIWFGGGAMNIFLMRQFMKTLPNTLIESAFLDGAGHLRCYWDIVLPNLKPMMFVLLLNSITATWSEWYNPFLYINTKEKWTVGLAVKNMCASTDHAGGVGAGALNIQMATAMVMSAIPLITYAVGQKNYVENVTLTGIKG